MTNFIRKLVSKNPLYARILSMPPKKRREFLFPESTVWGNINIHLTVILGFVIFGVVSVPTMVISIPVVYSYVGIIPTVFYTLFLLDLSVLGLITRINLTLVKLFRSEIGDVSQVVSKLREAAMADLEERAGYRIKENVLAINAAKIDIQERHVKSLYDKLNETPNPMNAALDVIERLENMNDLNDAD